MDLSFAHVENVEHIKMLTTSSTYGVGFLTAIVHCFCNLLGIECKMYDRKIEKAKSSAVSKLIAKASIIDAKGIMDIQIQIHDTTVFLYGIAYK